jgi:hypothetical protein
MTRTRRLDRMAGLPILDFDRGLMLLFRGCPITSAALQDPTPGATDCAAPAPKSEERKHGPRSHNSQH